jgi:hypothetical protein
LTAILAWGSVGKQVRPSIIALLASVPLVLLAGVGIVAALPDGSTVSDKTTPSDDDLGLLVPTYAPPVPRGDPNPTGPAFYGTRPFYSYLLSFDSGPTPAQLESDALLDSLSPGVRASYEAALLAQVDAQKREHERDEAEYAVFIEEHLRRLKE